MAIKKTTMLLLLCFGIGCGPSLLMGDATDTSTQPPVTSGAEGCSIELLRSFFPEKFVSSTLEKFNVPKEKRQAIINGLASRDKQVLKTVEEKAAKLNPNPFKDRDPKQRQVAVKLFRDTLLQIMTEVLNEQGITDQKQIQDMLDNINQEKAKNFRDCIEKQKLDIPGMKSQEPSSSMNSNTKHRWDSADNDSNTNTNDDSKSDDDTDAGKGKQG